MTPTFRWVFLLALVGRATSVPQPIQVDACALLCNPGAETESEQERDPVLFPRYPKVNCMLQSGSDEHQAWVILTHCLELCGNELTVSSKINCYALLSSLQANIGCYCEGFRPLSPNTMRLHESWRLNFVVEQLTKDLLGVTYRSPLDALIVCELHHELFKKNVDLEKGLFLTKCGDEGNSTSTSRTSREIRLPEEIETIETDDDRSSENVDNDFDDIDKDSDVNRRRTKRLTLKKLMDELEQEKTEGEGHKILKNFLVVDDINKEKEKLENEYEIKEEADKKPHKISKRSAKANEEEIKRSENDELTEDADEKRGDIPMKFRPDYDEILEELEDTTNTMTKQPEKRTEQTKETGGTEEIEETSTNNLNQVLESCKKMCQESPDNKVCKCDNVQKIVKFLNNNNR